jgi:hypothetical protein
MATHSEKIYEQELIETIDPEARFYVRDPVLGNRNIKGSALNSAIGMATVATSTSLAANKNTRYLVNTLANAATITLPATPTIGMFIEVIDANGAFETHSVILARNGELVNSSPDDLELDLNNITVGLTFVGNTVGWSVSVSTIEPYSTPSTGLTEVVTDATLTGSGTVLSPLVLAGGPLENGARTRITYGTDDPTGIPVDGEIYIKRSA